MMAKPASRSFAVLVRSLIFNALYYASLIVLMILALPTLVLPYPCVRAFIRSYSRTSLWLLRVVCNTSVEWRGVDKLPKGACIVACKHQSAWETFALYAVLDDPAFILKRELMWIPLFGWHMWKAGLIPIDRGAGLAALTRTINRASLIFTAKPACHAFPSRSIPGFFGRGARCTASPAPSSSRFSI